ncbi:hypothetical protein K469DRAFT_688555 [Zopfia rhizophila CBS 207.26]|uniref:HTH psq-type domain-containing protein n=1 Tax=Zopfia rhizophila CBS 207.26 TaxID=1314779 RepID=A0A6A6DXZ7_9PEZI|nr:hypothetical protein K469DRAFT_688555 [Zopfia rhizophila CBS 207.26]
MSWPLLELRSTAHSQTQSSPTPSKPQRKKLLTQAEKYRIRQFHQENPFVTHSHIAGFFGLERSTVSKILGQSPSDLSIPPQPQHFPPTMPTMSPAEVPVQNYTPAGSSQRSVQRALLHWSQQNQRSGVHVTRAMIRQEAASLAAMTWNQKEPADIVGSSDGPYNQNSYYDCAETQDLPLNTNQSSMPSQFWDEGWNLLAPLSPSSISAQPPPPQLSTTTMTTTATIPDSSLQDIRAEDISLALVPPHQCALGMGSHEKLRPSASDAQLGLDTVIAYMTASKPLSSFDYLCFEHLRERLFRLE